MTQVTGTDGPIEAHIELTTDEPSAEYTAALSAVGIADGFPFFVPTNDRVEALLAAVGGRPDDEVWPVTPPREAPLRLEDVAVVAAMAGCRPEWFWAVRAAYEGLAASEFRLFQTAMTTHPSGTLVLISGERAQAAGIAAGPGCLGPGFAANTSIGRSVALASSVFMGARIGGSDLTRQGSPAEYAYCCAENLAESPWPSLASDLRTSTDTAVIVLKCEGPRNVMDNVSVDPEPLLEKFAVAMSNPGTNSLYHAGCQTVVFINPEHAALLASSGWTRRDVQNFLWERARQPRLLLETHGGLPPQWPRWYHASEFIPVSDTPDDILVTVAGGPGPQSAVAVPWGFSRGSVVGVR